MLKHYTNNPWNRYKLCVIISTLAVENPFQSHFGGNHVMQKDYSGKDASLTKKTLDYTTSRKQKLEAFKVLILQTQDPEIMKIILFNLI